MNDTITHTRDAVHAAFQTAFREAENIAGDDQALDILNRLELSAYLPDGTGDITRQTALNAYDAMAEAAKEEYNPDDEENGDTIRADSCGDLVVNLAGGFLDNPAANADDIIADAWRELHLLDFPGFDDWRLETGTVACANEAYSEARRAAVVAEVKSWFL